MSRLRVAVVRGGIVALSIARELLAELPGAEILVFEKEDAVAPAVTIFAAKPMGVVVDRLGAHRTRKVGLLGQAVLLPVLGAVVST